MKLFVIIASIDKPTPSSLKVSLFAKYSNNSTGLLKERELSNEMQ